MAQSLKELRHQYPLTENKQSFCRDCKLIEIDYTNLSIKEKKPILGYCPIKGYNVLLSQSSCKKIKD